MDVVSQDVKPGSGVVHRLTSGLKPPRHREILTRCLSGTLSPAVTLMRLLIESEDAAVVRATIDEVTRRAASVSRSSDSLLRDTVDDLTQLVVENEPGCERIAEMLRSMRELPSASGSSTGRCNNRKRQASPSILSGIRSCWRGRPAR